MSSSKDEANEDVPSCHLYTLAPCTRIRNELSDLGINPDGDDDLDARVVNKVDGMRYEGGKGTLILKDHINRVFGEETEVSLLDVGSGFGGPSRLLTLERPNTRIVALEYVAEISVLAESLTRRCPQIKSKITHVVGDVTNLPNEIQTERRFQSAQAVLSLCHVPDLKLALTSVCQRLEDGGIFYVEDFWASHLDDVHKQHLQNRVGCPRVPPSDKEWVSVLKQAGFATVDFEDVTSSWQTWVHGRAEGYRLSMDRNTRVHGEDGANHMLEFYGTMDELFLGDLKGCRILAKK